ncbi:MAG: plasmid replication initiator protein [Mycolicibacterium sp.]|nr:plasmid replication initiator protein [Mycolicibacterium sp.]
MRREHSVSAPAQLPGLPDGIDHGAVVAQMIRRARSAGFNAWWQRVEAIGFCANPIHLAGLDDSGQEHRVFTRCNNRRAVVCPSCSDLYSRDTWQLIHAGLLGGHHDIPVTVAAHPQVFVTLTAPSFGAVHTACTGGGCHPRKAAQGDCRHGKPLWCNRSHRDTDLELGQPLCGACYDYLGHVLFTWHAPELWRRFTIRLRRDLKRELRRRVEEPEHTRIAFMKVVESQRRALPHFHAVIRLDAAPGPGQAPTAPDSSIGAHDLVVLVRQAATTTALALPGDKTARFGEQIDVEVIVSGAGTQNNENQISGRQIAGYLAKYVTKSVADFGIAMRRLSPGAIDQLDATEHVREILRTIAALSAEQPYTDMIAWLHTLGYRGHIVSKSRQFSTTMTALRERRTQWRKTQTHDALSATADRPADEPIPWRFQRSGHVSLGDRVLAISASDRAREQRIAARQAAGEGA